MPLSIDPNALFRIVLATDQNKVPRPAFLYRYLTGAEWRRLGALTQPAATKPDLQESLTRCYDAACIGLIGWENMGPKQSLPKTRETLEDLITPEEAQELIGKLMQQEFTPDDKKKFGSPSASGSEPSAKNPDPMPVNSAGPNCAADTASRSSVPAATDPVAPSALLERSRMTIAPPTT